MSWYRRLVIRGMRILCGEGRWWGVVKTRRPFYAALALVAQSALAMGAVLLERCGRTGMWLWAVGRGQSNKK
jgi:hypothetical protein